MSKSAWKMASDNKVSYGTVLRWIRKGYFGNVGKDKNGAYMLPDNLPLPYKADGKTERDTTLVKSFLDASDLGRIVHKNMFPRISDARYNRMLTYAVKAHLIEMQSPYPEVIVLASTPEGRAILNAEPKVQSKVVDRVLEGTKVALALAEFGLTFGPQIIEMISSVA